MADSIKPTRAQLAQFLPDQRLIRAFEKLFDVVPNDLITLARLIEEVGIEAVTAAASAHSNTSALTRIAEALEILTGVPKDLPHNRPTFDAIEFDRFAPINARRGSMWWNDADDTVNIGHGSGAVQQVGQETYLQVENTTGADIPNGSVVGFAGVDGYVEASPYIADDTQREDYFLGVTTQNIPDGAIGFTTLYGFVRDIDTTGSAVSETWATGEVLYASTTVAGAMTNVRPTAPNVVVSIAIITTVSATVGVVLVRPIVPVGFDYADYFSAVDQTAVAINTPYSVTFNETGIEHGVTLVSGTRVTAASAGLYAVSVKLQVTSSTASSGTIQAWLAVNGTNVPNSRADFTVKANGDTKLLSYAYQLSLVIGDYVEVKWAVSSTSLFLDSVAATAYSPVAPAASVFITQTQL